MPKYSLDSSEKLGTEKLEKDGKFTISIAEQWKTFRLSLVSYR